MYCFGHGLQEVCAVIEEILWDFGLDGGDGGLRG
jgi:hypothetical protein